jgi:dTDP-4-dehydrorhamnose 3,5-epimerase
MKIVKEIKKSKKIKDLTSIKLDTFQDYRGEIWTIYSEKYTDLNFVADKITISRFGVLRKNSETYGNVETFLISDYDPTVVIVPAGCVNAHLCLSDKCVFFYKWSEEYKGPDEQATIAWDDPELNIDWVIDNPILSDRDKNAAPYNGVFL